MSQQGNGDLASKDPIESSGAIAPEDFAKILEALKNSKEDQQALVVLLEPLFRRVTAEAISVMEMLLPERDKNPREASLFASARQRLLRVGNNSQRESVNVISDFIVHQVYKREVVARVVARTEGPHNLPRTVRLHRQDQNQNHGKR